MTLSAVPDISAALVAGVFSSLHCIGMCGPLVSLGCRAGLARGGVFGPVLFVIGKLGSYSLLGIIAGLVGASLLATGSVGRMTAWVSLIGGVLMLVFLMLSRLRFSANGIGRISVAIATRAIRTGRVAPLLLGVAAAFLPCGLLYAMVARSAAAAEPMQSMLLMQAFGLGTSPALLGVGILLRAIPQRWSRFASVAGELVIAITALVLIWRGIAGLNAPAAAPSCCG